MNNKCADLYTLTASLDLYLPMIPTPDARILRARLFRLIAFTDQRVWLAEFKIVRPSILPERRFTTDLHHAA